MLWTHNMKNTTVHPTFRPAGAPDNVTYEYGERALDFRLNDVLKSLPSPDYRCWGTVARHV